MRYIVSFFALCFTCCLVEARPSDTAMVRWQTLDEAEKTTIKQPLLVYFGAEWCAPCKALETGVFNQPEIEAALKPFRAVYIDGDSPDAPALMERFDVVVFPSLIAYAADGKESGRLVGSGEKKEFQRFMEAAIQPASPVRLLDRLLEGGTLSQNEWIVLSQIEVSEAAASMYRGEEGKKEVEHWQSGLAAAVARLDLLDPPLASAAKARLGVKSLVLDAISTKPEKSLASHRRALDSALRDAALLAAVEHDVVSFAGEILAYLQPDAGEARKSLARRLIAAMEAAYAREGSSMPWKMELLMQQLTLLDPGSDDVDADKTRFAERAEAALKEVASPKERLAMIDLAAEVLRRTGRELRGEAVLRETLAMEPDAYWLTGALGRYASKRGDLEASVGFAERAYRDSLARTNGVAWGNSWVQALIAKDPTDIGAVSAAANEVLERATGTRDMFRAWGAGTMQSFAMALGQWLASGARSDAAITSDIVQRFDRLCASVKNDATQLAACKACLDALKNPPVP